MASRRSITEIAFFDAVFLFTSSLLSLASRSFSLSTSLSLLSLIPVKVSALGFSGLELEVMQEEEEETGDLGFDSGMDCDSAGTVLVAGR